MRKKIVSALAIAVLIGTGAGYMYMDRIAMEHSGDDTQTATTLVADEVLTAYDDYSPWAMPVTDGDGMLYIPDGQTVTGNEALKVSGRYFSVAIPERWQGNVTVKAMSRLEEMVEEETEEEEETTHTAETYVLQFFYKDTYEKYRTQDYAYTEGADKMGKITEISYVAQDNADALAQNPRQMHIATITQPDNKKYEVYVLQISGLSGTADQEDGGALSYLADADYANCFAKTLQPHTGTKAFPNTYVEALALSYQKDNGEQTIPDMYTPVKGGSSAPYPASATIPDLPQYQAAANVYAYTDFSSPWTYQDAGAAYQYTAAESGGEIPASQTVTLGPSDVITDEQLNGTAQQNMISDAQSSAGSEGLVQGDYSDNGWADSGQSDGNIWGDNSGAADGYAEVYDNGDVSIWGE